MSRPIKRARSTDCTISFCQAAKSFSGNIPHSYVDGSRKEIRRIRAQAALLPAAFPVRVLSGLSFLLDTIHDRGKEVDENLHGAHRTVRCTALKIGSGRPIIGPFTGGSKSDCAHRRRRHCSLSALDYPLGSPSSTSALGSCCQCAVHRSVVPHSLPHQTAYLIASMILLS